VTRTSLGRVNRSVLSIRSKGSVLSIDSVGSVLSIGSVGSVLSVASIGSAASILSVGSFASVGSALSALSVASVLSWRSVRGPQLTGQAGRFSTIDRSRARSFRLARRMAGAINGAASFENPAGSPRFLRVIRVPPPAGAQV
jgi:hypothetical protein